MKNYKIGPKRGLVGTPESTTPSSPKITVKDPPDPTLFRGSTDVVRSVFKYGPKSATMVKKFIKVSDSRDRYISKFFTFRANNRGHIWKRDVSRSAFILYTPILGLLCFLYSGQNMTPGWVKGNNMFSPFWWNISCAKSATFFGQNLACNSLNTFLKQAHLSWKKKDKYHLCFLVALG